MNGLEALLGGGMGGADLRFVSGDELAKIRDGFVHIEDLKAGDKLKWKSDAYKDKRNGTADTVYEVFRVLSSFLPGAESGSNHQCDEVDFTCIAIDKNNGKIYEFAFDSRRFERVAE